MNEDKYYSALLNKHDDATYMPEDQERIWQHAYEQALHKIVENKIIDIEECLDYLLDCRDTWQDLASIEFKSDASSVSARDLMHAYTCCAKFSNSLKRILELAHRDEAEEVANEVFKNEH